MKDDRKLQAGAPQGATFQRGRNSHHRILVVEDDEEIRHLNAGVLIGSGYQVDAAENGAVAWEALQLKSYDLMVTDNEMPKVTGLELLKKLHAVRKALPVIMAPGAPVLDEFIRQPWLHPAAMLRKPYTVEELLVTVQQVLSENIDTREPAATTQKFPSQPSNNGWKM